MFKDKNVIITGGAGFIGSYLARKLISNGANVTILDNFSTGNIDNLKDIKDKIHIIRGDIKNYDVVLNALSGQEIVVHEAFPYAKVSQSLEEQFIEDNFIGTFNILKASVYCNVERVVYASSVAVYGQQQYLPIDEEHPKNPRYPYCVSKYASEKLCSSFSTSYGLTTVSLRYFNVYGPFYTNLDHSAVLTFCKRVIKDKPPLIYGTGDQLRDYTYVEDVVDGTLKAMYKKIKPGDVFNIGSGKGVKIIDLAKKIIDISGKDLMPKFADESEYRYFDKTFPWGITDKVDGKYIDTRSFVADISKARKILDYNPKTNLEDGLKITFDWVKNLKGFVKSQRLINSMQNT